MLTHYLYQLLLIVTILGTRAFSPLATRTTARLFASRPVCAVPGSLFEDPSGWFQHKMEVMGDKREITLYHILIKNDSDHYNPDKYAGDAESKLREIKQNIETNEEGCNIEVFAQAARDFSQDATTNTRGGRLGKFKRGQLEINVDDAAFNGEVGQVIGPVRSLYGMHLLWVMDRA